METLEMLVSDEETLLFDVVVIGRRKRLVFL